MSPLWRLPVERRRREAINEGINQIAQLVPNCDKNKGAILQRAIEYICQLHEEKKSMTERWEQSNMTTTHAINEISAQNAKLKAEVNRRGDIALKWIQRCRDAGLEFDDYDDEKELGQLEVDHSQTTTWLSRTWSQSALVWTGHDFLHLFCRVALCFLLWISAFYLVALVFFFSFLSGMCLWTFDDHACVTTWSLGKWDSGVTIIPRLPSRFEHLPFHIPCPHSCC